MFRMRRHLSARELLLASDHELSPRRRARVHAHLAACASCSARMRDVGRTLVEATDACRPDLPATSASAAAARARLRTALKELTAQPPVSSPRLTARWAPATGALLAVGIALLAAIVGLPASNRGDAVDAREIFLRPRADLTPGATRPVSTTEVCGPDRYGHTRPIPATVHQRVFESYGADVRRSADYELDHLITPELGGTSDPRNLWPQPFSGTPWNAYVKDELELYFHRMVCEGKTDFVSAQREMSTDWIAAYKRHFNTDAPLRDYAAAPLTERDSEFLRAELEERGLLTQANVPDGVALMRLWESAAR